MTAFGEGHDTANSTDHSTDHGTDHGTLLENNNNINISLWAGLRLRRATHPRTHSHAPTRGRKRPNSTQVPTRIRAGTTSEHVRHGGGGMTTDVQK